MKRGSICIPDGGLLGQWDFGKNEVRPEAVPIFSNRKRWWKCDNGHSWESTPNNRHKGRGCPYCSGNKTAAENSFRVLRPDLMRQWGKNNQVDPGSIRVKSNLAVEWKCDECGFEWKTSVANRTDKGSGCPNCKRLFGSSALEMRFYAEIKSVFGDALNRSKIAGVECDIYIPSLGIAVEIDGRKWHGDIGKDSKKNARVESCGIVLIRVREEGLVFIRPTDIAYHKRHIWDAICDLMELIGRTSGKSLDWYREGKRFIGDDEYKKLMASKGIPSGKLIFEANPHLRDEWDYEKNADDPGKMMSQSNERVWWRCRYGHNWEQSIYARTRGNGCPYCAGYKASIDNCLATVNPKLAKEWDKERNDATAWDVTCGSGKRIWWRCYKGHSWIASVNDRNRGRGCPYCSGKGHLVKEFYEQKIGNVKIDA